MARGSAWRLSLVVVVALAVLGDPAMAHLMVAQRGTLRFVDDSAFMVLSVPVSAFEGLDDDHDGGASPAELRAHATEIEETLRARVRLLDGGTPQVLEGVLVNLASHDDAGAASRQLVVLGRFAVADPQRPLTLALDLYGRDDDERTMSITVSRRDETRVLVLDAAHPRRTLFVPTWPSMAGTPARGLAQLRRGQARLGAALAWIAIARGTHTRGSRSRRGRVTAR